MDFEGTWTAVAKAALAGLLNALVWPLLILVALPLVFYTAGLATLVLNGLVLCLADGILPRS